MVFACVFEVVLLGMLLRRVLPEYHLSTDSKDVVKLGMGLIGTMAALVLALLIASAKSSFDTQSNEVMEMSTDFMLLDRTLATLWSGGEGSPGCPAAGRETAAVPRDLLWSSPRVPAWHRLMVGVSPTVSVAPRPDARFGRQAIEWVDSGGRFPHECRFQPEARKPKRWTI